MEYRNEDDRVMRRTEAVWRTLDSLEGTDHRRRAALLANAGVKYTKTVPLDSYATDLHALADESLLALEHAAALTQLQFPLPVLENPVPEEVRARFGEEIREILTSMDSDEELTPRERQHFRGMGIAIVAALEDQSRAGAEAAVSASKAVLGDTAINRTIWSAHTAKAWARKLVRLAWRVVSVVSVLTGLAADGGLLIDGIGAFGDAIGQLLGSPSVEAPPSIDFGDDEVHDGEVVPDPDEPQ